MAWIDYARGIAIILVLYRHVFEGIKQAGVSIVHYLPVEYANIMFYSFRMPLFFIVSGVFVARSLHKRGIQKFIENKARTIIYPYIIWGSLQIILQYIFSSYINTDKEHLNLLYLLYSPREVGQFWYLYALFNVAVLYVLLKVYAKLNAVQCTALGLLMFYLSSILSQNNINIWFLADILHYFVFFAVGDLLSNQVLNSIHNEAGYFKKRILIWVLPFIATQAVYLYINLENPSVLFDYVEYSMPVTFLLIAFLGCGFVILFSQYLDKTGKIKWLRIVGEHSLYIYVVHVIVMAATRIFMMHVLRITNLPLLLITGILVGLLVPILIYKLAMKANMPWLFTLENRKAIKLKKE
ncbi:MAG: acyltransferase [Niastella sp.]|nr:acyltransferase [Niastella sp.]